ncbi:MAG: N-methyl-L-tryptophan oxidase [Thermoplasmata archaeon]
MERRDAGTEWLIVGAGAAGSAISYFLARRGIATRTFEQFRLNHPFGSSHGRTRILRTTYSEGPEYVPLVLRARTLWRELGRQYRSPLFLPTGTLIIGRAGERMVEGALTSARTWGRPHRVLRPEEVSSRFPGFLLDPDEVAVWDPAGGVLRPERALRAFVGLARDRGSKFSWGETVHAWTATEEGVEVRTSRKTYRGRGLILSPGAWLGGLAPSLDLPLTIEGQSVFFLRSEPDRRAVYRSIPAFVWQRSTRGYFYGTPDLGHGLKVASDAGFVVQDPDHVPRGSSARERNLVTSFARRHLPGALGRIVEEMRCLYTNTPDHRFVLDHHPDHRNVIVVSTCSGHGFKFMPAVGEAAARLVETGHVPPGWEPFRMPRALRKDRTSPGRAPD